MMIHSLAELNWQCHRGIKELDNLLVTYLTNIYPTADQKEQQLFEKLLTYEDNDLFALLLNKQCPKESQFAPLITKICTRPFV